MISKFELSLLYSLLVYQYVKDRLRTSLLCVVIRIGFAYPILKSGE